jgi:hypothetical protein
MRGGCNWAHGGSNGGSGVARGGSGKRRRGCRGGAASSARISAECGGELIHVWAWKLGWVPGRSYESFVGHGRERRERFTGVGNNGGRWLSGLTRGREGGF